MVFVDFILKEADDSIILLYNRSQHGNDVSCKSNQNDHQYDDEPHGITTPLNMQNFPFDSTLPPGLSQNNFPFETEADFMDWLEFVSAMVQSLAWPAALMICVLLLKEPLSDRMKELIKLKYKDFELEFDKRLQELVSVREKRLSGLISVRSAQRGENMIESAWSDVHNVLRETASTFDQDAIRLEGDELIQMLHDRGILQDDAAAVLSELSALRRDASDGASIAGALAYKTLCREEAERLRLSAEQQTGI